jgi:diguanylate cyclase (GGDEF)-like protein
MHRFRFPVDKTGQTSTDAHHKAIVGESSVNSLDGSPFRTEGLLRRLGPFAVVALLAEASLALPPGPSSKLDTVISAVLLFLVVVGCLLPWNRLPEWSNIAPPLVFVGWVLAIDLAAGGSTSGVGIIILIPLVWVALYHRPYQSAITVMAVLVYELISSLDPVTVAASVIVRRLTFWLALAALISFATHQLRRQIREMLAQREGLIDQRELALADMTLSVAKLNERDRENQLLLELGDALQGCSTAPESYELIRSAASQLFQGGALSIFDEPTSRLVTMTSWGQSELTGQSLSMTDCEALRHGQAHTSIGSSSRCAHMLNSDTTFAICVPMFARGDIVGVFHVVDFSPSLAMPLASDARQSILQLALAIGEQVGMSMANFRLTETLRDQSIRDPLTNLFNRRYMEETFFRELARAARDHVDISIMQIDIDHFKDFNDSYGHDVGDALLRAFGDLLFSLFRDSDVPCRFGGEEFTLILLDSSLDETEQRARDLQRQVMDLKLPLDMQRRDSPPPPTLSIGIAGYPHHGDSADTLIRAADQALYAAKARGRNTIVRAGALDALGLTIGD